MPLFRGFKVPRFQTFETETLKNIVSRRFNSVLLDFSLFYREAITCTIYMSL